MIGTVTSTITHKYVGKYLTVNGMKHTWDSKLKLYVWRRQPPPPTNLEAKEKR